MTGEHPQRFSETDTECSHCYCDLTGHEHGITGLDHGPIERWCSACLAQGHAPGWLRQGSAWVHLDLKERS